MSTEKIQTIGSTIVILKELSADERVRDLYERREKERRDIAMVVRAAEARGEARGEARAEARGKKITQLDNAKNMLAEGLSIEKVARCTGLTYEEIEGLGQ